MKHFTSDTHFGHANVIKYSKRPFKSVEEMDEALIANWNAKVLPTDEVYHTGDFAFAQADRVNQILLRLNGVKYFIFGNHDAVIQKDRELQKHFVWCRHYHELSIPNGEKYPLKIVLHHFPILEWNKAHHGAMHLHGHTHGNCKYPWPKAGPNGVVGARILDIGTDVQNYSPISLDEVIKMLTPQPHITHHDRT